MLGSRIIFGLIFSFVSFSMAYASDNTVGPVSVKCDKISVFNDKGKGKVKASLKLTIENNSPDNISIAIVKNIGVSLDNGVDFWLDHNSGYVGVSGIKVEPRREDCLRDFESLNVISSNQKIFVTVKASSDEQRPSDPKFATLSSNVFIKNLTTSNSMVYTLSLDNIPVEFVPDFRNN